jgi:hypothetical protein
MEVVVLACANFFATADLLEKCSCAKGCFLNFDRQSKRTIGETTTSPTSNSLPMPPAVPVVMTSVGCTSVMIWRQTSMFVRCLLHRASATRLTVKVSRGGGVVIGSKPRFRSTHLRSASIALSPPIDF